MTEKKLNRIQTIEKDVLENKKDREKKLQDTLIQLQSLLDDSFYDNAYDFSDQKIQLDYIRTVKRLFHPKAILATELNGKIQKKIITRNYDHNNEDKSITLDHVYISWILKNKNIGRPNGVDSTEIPKAEYKSVKNKSPKLYLSPYLALGQIDKIDEKEGDKHNIYNRSSKISLVSGVFEENSIDPIIVFQVEYHAFQQKVYHLIQDRAQMYRSAIKEIAEINGKIKNKEPGYRVGDTVKLSHLKKETMIRGDQNNPQLIQTPRDTLSLQLIDFIDDIQIIHVNDKWKDNLVVDEEILKEHPHFRSQLRQYYTQDEFSTIIRTKKEINFENGPVNAENSGPTGDQDLNENEILTNESNKKSMRSNR